MIKIKHLVQLKDQFSRDLKLSLEGKNDPACRLLGLKSKRVISGYKWRISDVVELYLRCTLKLVTSKNVLLDRI